MIRIVPLCAGWLLLTASATFAADSPPEKAPVLELPVPESVLHESQREWFGIYLNSAKAGWGTEFHEPGTLNGKPCIVSTMHMNVRMKALDNVMQMEMKTVEYFSNEPPYRLLLVEESEKLDGQQRKVEVRHREGTSYTALITEAGKTRTEAIEEIDYRLTHAITPQLWAADPARKPGDVIGSLEFSAERLRPTRQTSTIRSQSDWSGPGGRIPVWEINVYDHDEKINSLTKMSRLDGSLVNATFGQIIEVRMEPEAVARKMSDGDGEDLFLATSIRCDRKLGRAEDLDELTIELTADGGRKVPDIQETANQTVERTADDRIIIRLSRGKGKAVAASEADRSDFLKSTPRYPVNDASVRALAAKAAGSAATDREKVINILRFTDSYIRDSYEVEALSVMDLMKSRKGDCSAHALMFTALARAAGIPAREAGGWLYMGNQYQSFGGHAWNEVILDGKWIPVDPVWNQIQLDAGHIQQHAGDPEGSMIDGLVVGLKAKVISSKRKP